MLTFIIIAKLSLFFHPIHLSITNISYIEEEKHFEMTIRLFRDDFETILNHKYEERVLLTDDNITKEEIVTVNNYINDMFLFLADNDTISLKYNDCVNDEKMIVVSYQTNEISTLENLEIKNILMMDLFLDQKNLLIISYKQKEKGYQFTINDYQQKIVL